MGRITFSLRFTGAVLTVLLSAFPMAAQTQMQIYGAWHCSTDGCSWGLSSQYDNV